MPLSLLLTFSLPFCALGVIGIAAIITHLVTQSRTRKRMRALFDAAHAARS